MGIVVRRQTQRPRLTPRSSPPRSRYGVSQHVSVRGSHPQHHASEPLDHAIIRMRSQGYTAHQVARQVQRWHPGWSVTEIASRMRAARNPVASISKVSALPKTASPAGTPIHASSANSPSAC